MSGQTAIFTTAVSGTGPFTQSCNATFPNIVSGGFNNVDTGGNGQFQFASYPTATGPSPLGSWTVQLTATDATWNIYALCSK
jgi:hypothetical protein